MLVFCIAHFSLLFFSTLLLLFLRSSRLHLRLIYLSIHVIGRIHDEVGRLSGVDGAGVSAAWLHLCGQTLEQLDTNLFLQRVVFAWGQTAQIGSLLNGGRRTRSSRSGSSAAMRGDLLARRCTRQRLIVFPIPVLLLFFQRTTTSGSSGSSSASRGSCDASGRCGRQRTMR